jgi:hypothetical protein
MRLLLGARRPHRPIGPETLNVRFRQISDAQGRRLECPLSRLPVARGQLKHEAFYGMRPTAA